MNTISPIVQGRTLTLATLRQHGACEDQRRLFCSTFGKSVVITEALCLQHAADFDFDWAAAHLLGVPAYTRYKAERAPAYTRYKAVSATAAVRYEAVSGPSYAKYKAAVAAAHARYEAAAAFKACEAVISIARAAYEAECAPAHAKYKAECAPAFARAYIGDAA